MGEKRKLERWDRIVEYFNELGKSPCVRVTELGKSTEGNPFLLAIITAPENMKRLARIESPRPSTKMTMATPGRPSISVVAESTLHSTPACSKIAAAFYGAFLENVHPVSRAAVAEMVKLLENTFRSVNIGLVNEMALMCDRMGIDVWEVIDAAKTKPFGFMPFYPGPGLGGHCIPIDPFYLSWKARQFDMHTEFIELAGKTNEEMPYYVVQRLMTILNNHRKPLAGSRILILGVAYKANIDDMRESPAIKIANLLRKRDAELVYHDSYVPEFIVDGVSVPSVELTEEEVAKADAVVVVTDHSNVDYHLVVRSAKLVLDTRNVLKAFDDNYRIFHYPSSLPCDHVLLTPNGVVALEVVNLNGFFSYRNGRWKEAMTMGRALRYLVEERVTDPLMLSQSMAKDLGDRFDKEFGEQAAIPIKALTVFTHPAVELEVEGGPIPACKVDKLRKQISRQGSRLEHDTYDKACSYLEKLTVH